MNNDDEEHGFELFQEPNGYYQSPPSPRFDHFKTTDGRVIELRLVGQSPLWGHYLWQAGLVVSKFLERESARYLAGKRILELGAGAGLPSLIAAHCGASEIVVTDYPDNNLIENLQYNVDEFLSASKPCEHRLVALPYLWGADPSPILEVLVRKESSSYATSSGFDTLILADLLFNHSCHDSLYNTVKLCLAKRRNARALVFFTPYRPWLFEKDMAFFDVVRQDDKLRVEKIGEWKMDKVMFEDDSGDEDLRKTVFGFELRWRPECLS